MKNFLAVSLFLIPICLARAAANDTMITFSTRGPDTYADGTTVRDGECYALVWVRTGAAFAGFAADGKAVDAANSAVVVHAPVAKGGRCPTVVFEVDAALAEQYAGGTFGVYLLDTRLADGRVGGVNASGVPVAVNGWGEVKVKGEGEGEGEGEQRTVSASRTLQTLQTSQPSVCVTTKSEIPADAPKPQITAMRIVGDKVFLTVKNTIPCLQYAAKEVNVGGEGGSAVNLQPSTTTSVSAQGAATVDEEITVIAPKKGDSGFYSVGRR